MTTTPKTPTASGISRLLAKAGFEKSESSATRIRGYRRSSEGFIVAQPTAVGEVEVRYTRGFLPQSEADRIRPGMLADYAEAITGAGYSVETRDNLLIVTAKEG